MLFLFVIFFLLFFFLSWKNFRLATGLFIILLPSYLIRFNIGSLPTTLLEISFGALFLVWLIKYFKDDKKIIWEEIKNKKVFFVFVGLFFIASAAGIFMSDMRYYSLGQWRAYFLEPIALFLVLMGRVKPAVIPPTKYGGIRDCHSDDRGEIDYKDVIYFLALSTISVSVVALIQKFTGQLYPPSLWDDELAGRATSFFTSPNAVGLYLGPIVMLALGVIARRSGATTKQSHDLVATGNLYLKTRGLLRRLSAPRNDTWIPAFAGMTMWGAGMAALLAIFFSFSQGAWIALGAGLIIFSYFIGYKKIALAAVIIGIILTFSIAPIRSAIFFQDQAGQNRLELWGLSWNYLKASPENFVFGAGIRQFFRKIQKPVYAPEEMERLIYPHNIFLNFWTETGLFGMISFVGIFAYLSLVAWRAYRSDGVVGAGLLAALAIFLIHGLVDVPYFKNDLAFLFWIIAAVSLRSSPF